MNKLAEIINSMNYRDLKSVEKDLYEGNLSKLIKYKKHRYEQLFSKSCPTCGTDVEHDQGYRLMFGKKDFRKQASFCGQDCLSFFVNNLREEKNIHS